MNYLLSKYSYLFSDNNKYFLFNTQSLLFSEISKDLYNKLNNHTIDIDQLSNADFLIAKKVIVTDTNKDLYYYTQKLKSYRNFLSQEQLGLIIVPYLGCNFACPYCYEKHKRESFMSDETIDKLILFIKSHELARSLNITWYGGEPLVGFEIIQKIFNHLKYDINIPISRHSIVTNGYLLNNPHIINFFQEHKLDTIQITLDGDKESHNKTRKLKKTGEPTYDTILKNIHNIIKEWPNTKIYIRVNINAAQSGEYYNIYRNLRNEFGENINIYPGFIRIENKTNTNFECGDFIKDKEQELSLKMYELGLDNECFPQHASKGCMANCINHYIIGTEGEIYKCWNDVGEQSRIVGYIDKNEMSNMDLYTKYVMRSSIFEDEKCKDCLFFPICSGGCSWYRLRNMFENGEYNICTIQKDNDALKKILLTRYQKMLHSKENFHQE